MEKYTYEIAFDYTGFEIGVWRSDGAFVPKDESNSDYQAYLRWQRSKMAIDFPNSPSVNQTYTVGSRTWKIGRAHV